MRRILLTAAVLLVAGALAWEFVPIPVTVWDGGFDLTVHVASTGGPMRKVTCEAFGTRAPAEQSLEFLIPPDSASWSATADPFVGQTLTVRVAVSGHESPMGRALSRSQFRHLVVIGEFQDGRRVGKLVDIPDVRVTREISVVLP